MMLQLIALLFVLSTHVTFASKDTFHVYPFYIRSRIYDSHSANVQFEIARETDHRTCRLYRFTVRRNTETAHVMPEQDLTFWRNSLELLHLDVGSYEVCATICSEYEHQPLNESNNTTKPITACISFETFRSHFLILILYVLVLSILAFSQFIFTLRKRKFKARIKLALTEVEVALQKWRYAQTQAASTDQNLSCVTLQGILALPASPLEHSSSEHHLVDSGSRSSQQPITFHLCHPEEASSIEIP